MLEQRFFWNAVRNTFSIFLLDRPADHPCLLIAVALDSGIRAKGFWRMSVLLPYVIAPVAVVLIFNDLFGDRYGLFNQLLGWVGIDPSNGTRTHSRATSPSPRWSTRWTGYNALILLAAMQTIPRDYYEAALIDGAGPIRTFFSITVPQLRATIIFVTITSTIGGLQIFDEPRMFDQYGQGGADRQWQTLTIYLYNLGWNQKNFGRASAVAWLLFLIIVVIAIVNYFVIRRIASKEAR